MRPGTIPPSCADLCRRAPAYEPNTRAKSNDKGKAASSQAERPNLATIPLGEFCRINFAPREYVLAPILPERGLAMLYAGRGVGKTRVGMGLSYAVASGGAFLRWKAPKPRRVLYVDGEMPAELMKEIPPPLG